MTAVSSIMEPQQVPPEVPKNVPTLVEIKKSIPAHCFVSSLPISLSYVLKDFTLIATLYSLILKLDSSDLPLAVKIPIYPVYWFVQGTVFGSIFVLGHECGHVSFSRYSWVNDTVGNILHSFLLVPYYPWKLTHLNHHKNTGNIDKDEHHYPIRKKLAKESEIQFFIPYWGLGIAWFKYLITGYNPRATSHLNPWAPLLAKNSVNCIISIICCGLWFYMLLRWHDGAWLALTRHYMVPIFVYGSWLILLTFLHHQDDNVPWYGDNNWTYVRGQLSSVDRNYGILHKIIHNIGTHQVHHLLPIIPHYHLEEATIAFRKAYPHLVRTSEEPIIKAFTRLFWIKTSEPPIPDETEYYIFGSHVKKAQ